MFLAVICAIGIIRKCHDPESVGQSLERRHAIGKLENKVSLRHQQVVGMVVYFGHFRSVF